MAFETLAERKQTKIRIALSGVSGSGKTFSALLFAAAIDPDGKIGLIDSEHDSAKLYAGEPGIPPFHSENLEDHTPQSYIEKIKEAADAGITTLIVDSYSHSWLSALEAIDRSGGWARGGKTISPLVTRLMNTLLTYPGHVIATIRSKTDYAVETNDAGKVTGMKKLGIGPVARPDSEYDFTFMFELTREGALTVSKSRVTTVQGVYDRNTDIPKIARTLKAWLDAGSPTTERDTMADRLRFVRNDEELRACVPAMKELFEKDPGARAVLKPIYDARKQEFSESGE